MSDLPTWFAEHRRRGGVCGERVQHPVGDDRYVVVGFSTHEQAQRFLDFLQTTVWASRDASPALAGTLRTRILEPIGDRYSWLRSTMQKRLPSGSASTTKSGSSG